MNGSNLAKMAWRNLWRNRRRTIITLSSIAFGIMLAVLFTGLGDCSFTRMIDLAARSGGGHITFQHPDYLETPSLKKTITDVDTLKELALQNRNVNKVVSRIVGHTMLATATENQQAFFVGIDPKEEDEQTFNLMESLIQGEMFQSTRDKGIIIGKKLADNLEIRMGHKVVYTMTDKQGEIVSGLARVSGIVRTGAPTIDGSICLLPIDSLRKLLGYLPNEAIQMALFVDDQRKIEKAANMLRAKLDASVSVVTWRQSRPELAAFISMKIAGTRFFEVVIMILVAAGIFNTLFVSVMERMREFGIMMAIGFSPSQLFHLIILESFWLSLIGIFIAGIVTSWPYYYLNTNGIDLSIMVGEKGSEIAGVAMESILYVDIFMENAAAIVVVAIVATLLSGLYPAWKAGRVVPAESIKIT